MVLWLFQGMVLLNLLNVTARCYLHVIVSGCHVGVIFVHVGVVLCHVGVSYCHVGVILCHVDVSRYQLLSSVA